MQLWSAPTANPLFPQTNQIWTKLNKQEHNKEKGKKGKLTNTKKEKKSTNLSQKIQKKVQNLPPEEESDNSNERGGG